MGKRKMRGFKKGKFNLKCLIYGHSQNRTKAAKRFKCYDCGATWDDYTY